MAQCTLITWQAYFQSAPAADLETVIDTVLRHLKHVTAESLAGIVDDLKAMLSHSQISGKSSRRVLRDFFIAHQTELPKEMYGPALIWSEAEAPTIQQVQRAAEA